MQTNQTIIEVYIDIFCNAVLLQTKRINKVCYGKMFLQYTGNQQVYNVRRATYSSTEYLFIRILRFFYHILWKFGFCNIIVWLGFLGPPFSKCSPWQL